MVVSSRRSPILLLEENIRASPSMLAPEWERDLKRLDDVHGFSIEFVDEPKFGIRVSIEEHTISLPIAALEYIWARALEFWVVSQEYRKAQDEGAQLFDLH